MGLGRTLASVLLVGVAGGCVDDAFLCSSDDQCVLDGAQGTCEPSSYCSFPEPECTTGRRYGEYSPPELRGECVQQPDLLSPDLGVVDLDGTDLRGVDLSGADLSAADFSNIDLSGSDLAAVLFCPAGALICDDFESGNASKWMTDTRAPSTVTVDTVRPHGGLYSVHAAAPANGGIDSYAEYLVTYSKVPPMTFSVRFWLYAQTAPGNYGLFVTFRRGASANIGLGANPTNNFVITENDATVPDHNSTTALPLGQWICVQLRVDYPTATASQGRVRAFLGNTAVLDFTPTPLMTNGDLRFGLVRAPGDNAETLFFDDISAAYEDTPCP